MLSVHLLPVSPIVPLPNHPVQQNISTCDIENAKPSLNRRTGVPPVHPEVSQFSLERLIQHGGQQGVEFGGGFGLQKNGIHTPTI